MTKQYGRTSAPSVKGKKLSPVVLAEAERRKELNARKKELNNRIKKICLFCAKSHRVTPKLCRAKGRVMFDLIKTMPLSLAIRHVESGQIDLDWAAQKYLKRMK